MAPFDFEDLLTTFRMPKIDISITCSGSLNLTEAPIEYGAAAAKNIGPVMVAHADVGTDARQQQSRLAIQSTYACDARL